MRNRKGFILAKTKRSYIALIVYRVYFPYLTHDAVQHQPGHGRTQTLSQYSTCVHLTRGDRYLTASNPPGQPKARIERPGFPAFGCRLRPFTHVRELRAKTFRLVGI